MRKSCFKLAPEIILKVFCLLPFSIALLMFLEMFGLSYTQIIDFPIWTQAPSTKNLTRTFAYSEFIVKLSK